MMPLSRVETIRQMVNATSKGISYLETSRDKMMERTSPMREGSVAHLPLISYACLDGKEKGEVDAKEDIQPRVLV